MKDPSVKYYCIKQKNTARCRLIMSISWDGYRIIHYTGILLKEFQWDRRKREFLNIGNKDALNSSLSSFKKKVIALHRSLSIRYGKVSIKHFRNELARLNFNPGYTITEAFVKFIEENEADWSKNTFLKCKSLYPKLTRFSELYGSSGSLEAADREFLQSFEGFLRREGLGSTSCYSYLNLMKWFLGWARSRSLMINDDFKGFNLSALKSEDAGGGISPLYLHWDELLKLFSSEPSGRKLQYCRDIYSFMAFTGCRLDELQDLKKEDVADGLVKIGGRNPRKIPLNHYALEITERYRNKYFRGGFFFPVYTKMTLNKYLRELSVFLNFERKLTIRRRGRVFESEIYELITINSAKWTFFANAVKLGLPAEVAQSWNGAATPAAYKRIKEDFNLLEKKGIALINKYYEDTL